MKYATLLSLATLLGLSTLSLGEGLSKGDQARISVQGICPVSGQRLGEHGPPVKGEFGAEVVYLCCEDCRGEKANPQHWSTIHANFARAQEKCPVMNRQLPAKPDSIVVDGRVVYVCCPPCSRKIVSDSEKYLAEVDALYLAHLQAQAKAASHAGEGHAHAGDCGH